MQKLNPTKIDALVAKLANGGKVSGRDLTNVLGEGGLVEYEQLWSDELERRKFFDNKPMALADYEAMLKRADFLTARADKTATVNSAKNLRVLAKQEYQAALAYLKTYIGNNASAEVWLDRDVFGLVGIGSNANQVPRLVTSRSEHKLTDGASAAVSKEDVKRTVLKNTLDRLVAAENTDEALAISAKLKVMLENLIKRSRGW